MLNAKQGGIGYQFLKSKTYRSQRRHFPTRPPSWWHKTNRVVLHPKESRLSVISCFSRQLATCPPLWGLLLSLMSAMLAKRIQFYQIYSRKSQNRWLFCNSYYALCWKLPLLFDLWKSNKTAEFCCCPQAGVLRIDLLQSFGANSSHAWCCRDENVIQSSRQGK